MLRAYAETLQECVVLILGEAVRFQRRKPLNRFIMFKTNRLCYGIVNDVGATVHYQLEPTLAALERCAFIQGCASRLAILRRLSLRDGRWKDDRRNGYAVESPATSMSRRQWSLAPHSSTELRARTEMPSWKPREAKT